MKKTEISSTGIVNSNGSLSMYMGELNDFFSKWVGHRVIARFYVAPKGSSNAFKKYYYSYIIPTVKRAMWNMGERMTDEETDFY